MKNLAYLNKNLEICRGFLEDGLLVQSELLMKLPNPIMHNLVTFIFASTLFMLGLVFLLTAIILEIHSLGTPGSIS